jgi:hypothetical protein
MPKTNTMNFQAYLEDAWRIIKQEPVILILGGLVVQLLTILSMGILAGPFLGGYFLLIICYLRDNKKPSFSDIFSGLQQFGKLFPYFLVLLVIFIGFMLLILPGFLFATWWIYVLPLMIDRKLSYSEAMRLSMNRVNETGFLMHLVFLLLISVIPIMLLNFLSAMMPFLFVLKILLPPFQAGCLASLYIDQFKEIEEKTPAAEIPIILPSEETADAETGEETHATATEQTHADGADQNQSTGQPEKGENLTPERQHNESVPDSENIIEESQGDSGENSKEK